jgi:two-component system, OmpR family, sensor histidine kinase VicK
MDIDEIVKKYGYSAPEVTEVINGYQNMFNMQVYAMTVVEKGFDTVWDSKHVLAISKYFAEAKEMFILEIKKGIKVRIIADVTHENLGTIKELLDITEIRHIGGLVGSFGILDRRQYMIFTTYTNDSEQPEQGIFSSVKKFVEQQQYVFDNLWKRAIPAKLRINELEHGIIPDFVESISDSSEINRIFFELMDSASKEILLFFTNDHALRRVRNAEGFFIFLKKALHRDVGIRILTEDSNGVIRNEISKNILSSTGKNLLKDYENSFEIRYTTESVKADQTLMIVDDRYCFVIESKDDDNIISNKDDVNHNGDSSGKSFLAGEFANYTNIRSSIRTNTCIFETYWTKSFLTAS